MGYGLSLFRVPEPMLARVCGKNDQALLNDALKALQDALESYDKQMDAPDLENNDIDISHADALREIFAGRFTKGVNGARYGWAFECLCHFIGERLSNVGFVPCRIAWYEELDKTVASNEIPLKFTNLIYRSPVAIPESDDWPCVGHWGANELAALGPLAELIPRIDDAEMKESLSTALGWLQKAAKDPGLIIGFHG
jgi:hypothetical protein